MPRLSVLKSTRPLTMSADVHRPIRVGLRGASVDTEVCPLAA